jgi:uncharacterized membrane protein YkvA (DUF1232 family)
MWKWSADVRGLGPADELALLSRQEDARIMSRFNLSRSEMIMIILALIYVVSPIDFIPELVAGPIGLTDDMAAAALIGATLIRGWKRPGTGDSASPETSG